MLPRPPVPLPLLLAVALLAGSTAGCGGRTPLGEPLPFDAGPRLDQPGVGLDQTGSDTVGSDTVFVDVPPPDVPPPPDFPTPDGPVSCTIGQPVEMVRAGSAGDLIRYPALARGSSGNLLLAYTLYPSAQGGPEVHALSVDSYGLRLSGDQRVGAGEGGTVQPAELTGAPYALLYLSGVELQFALLDDSGFVLSDPSPSGLQSASLRPGLAIGDNLLAVAWDDLDQRVAQVLIADPFTGAQAQLGVNGILPWVATVPGAGDQVFVFGVGLGRVVVDRYDVQGQLQTTREVLFDTSYPRIGRVVDSPEGGMAVLGDGSGVDPAATVYLDLGGSGVTSVLTGEKALDLGAAYDPASGWLLAAASSARQDGSAGLTFHALSPRGFTLADLGQGVLFDPSSPPRPAVATTGRPGEFLVAYEAQVAGGAAVVLGVSVSCTP